MADKTTSQETASGPIADVDFFRGVQGGVNVKVAFSQVKTWITAFLATATEAVAGLIATGQSGVGYGTGAGGVVTQATNKGTTVILNKVCGQITTNNAALGSATSIAFILTNTSIAATDLVIANLISGFVTAGTYQVSIEAIAAGSCKVHLRNVSGGSLSEALVIGFAVIKGVIA